MIRFFLRLLVLAAIMLPGSGICRTAALGPDTSRLDLAPFVEILEDPGGQLGIDEVRQQGVSSWSVPSGLKGDLNLGYSASTWWIRLDLAGAPDIPRSWLLEVAFPTLDDVAFYPGGTSSAVRAGDALPFAARPSIHRNFVFPLSLAPGENEPLYLRITSSGTLTVPLTLWQAEAFSTHTQQSYALHALYFGMLLALGLYNLMLWFSLRDPSYLAYVAFVTAMAVGQGAQSGLGYQYLWPDWQTWEALSFNSGYAATGLFGAVFTRIFLNTRRHHPRIDRVLLVLGAGFAFTTIGPLFIPYRFAAVMTSLTGIAFATIAVGAAVASVRRGDPGARFFLLAWTVLLAGVALMGLRNLAWLPTNFLTTNGIQIGSALEMLLLSFALADRVHILRREKEAALAQAAKADALRIAALEQSERMLEIRVEERTHELETANARLIESEARMRDMAHHDPLTGLPNRILLFDRIGQEIRRARRTKSRFTLLLIDLDGFKAVNDTLGHDAGDQLLAIVARRMEAAVRNTDTVARLGGDEFVVLLEETASQEAALQIAGKLVEALRAPAPLDAGEVVIGASIGIALWPENGEETGTLLRSADRAMYAAKRRGRNCIELSAGC